MVNKHLGLKFENVFPPPEGSNIQRGDVAVLRNVLYCDFMTQVLQIVDSVIIRRLGQKDVAFVPVGSGCGTSAVCFADVLPRPP